jgi:putative peptide zinc metalloprotease protein
MLALDPDLHISSFDSLRENSYLLSLRGTNLKVSASVISVVQALTQPADSADIVADRMGIQNDSPTRLKVAELISNLLIPKGIVILDEVKIEAVHKSEQTYLAFRYTREIISAKSLQPTSNFFAFLYRPEVFVVAMLIITGSLFLSLREMIGEYTYMDLVLSISPFSVLLLLLSSFFHELGHLAAASAFKQAHGGIGIGLNVGFPVIYADVSGVWRLKRHQRLIVDLGGFYFQAIFGCMVMVTYLFFRDASLIATVFAIWFSILFNALPFSKSDGYWVLSDLFSITNLHEKIASDENPQKIGFLATYKSFTQIYLLILLGWLSYSFTASLLAYPDLFFMIAKYG